MKKYEENYYTCSIVQKCSKLKLLAYLKITIYKGMSHPLEVKHHFNSLYGDEKQNIKRQINTQDVVRAAE